VCLVAHDSEFRRWPDGVDYRKCQTFAASPAEPGELSLGFRSEQFWAAHRAMHIAAWQIAHKRAKDRGETVLRPEAVEAVYEELNSICGVSVKISPQNWH
jgi:hypothetical protein